MMDEDFDIRQEQMSSTEKEFENALRPLAFNDFSGQQQVVENLEPEIHQRHQQRQKRDP